MALPGRHLNNHASSAEDQVSYSEQYHLLIGRALIEFREMDILAMRAARRQSTSQISISAKLEIGTVDAVHLSYDEAVLLTLIGEFAQANEIFKSVNAKSSHSQQRLPTSVIIFAALSIAYILPNSHFWQRMKLRRQFRKLRSQLLTLSSAGREQFRHKIVFLDALYQAMHYGQLGSVVTKLEDALYLSRVQGDVKDEACIAEYLGRYLLAQHCPTMAASALTAARDAYQKWGLTAKVGELDALRQVSPLFFSQDRR